MAADWAITVHTLQISLDAQALALALLDIWPGYYEIEEHLKQLPTAMQLSADTLTMLPTGEITAQLSLRPETSWRSLNEIHLDIGLPKADTHNEFGAAQATLSLKHNAGTGDHPQRRQHAAAQHRRRSPRHRRARGELLASNDSSADIGGYAGRRPASYGRWQHRRCPAPGIPETWAGLQQVTIDQLRWIMSSLGRDGNPLHAAMRISVDSGARSPCACCWRRANRRLKSTNKRLLRVQGTEAPVSTGTL